MNLRSQAFQAAAFAVAVAACSDTPTELELPARLRVVNAVVNLNTTFPGAAVDVLVDSATAPPGAAALPLNTAGEYAELAPGVHGFITRLAGDSRPGGPANLFQFDARVQIAPDVPYTFLALGVAPDAEVPSVGDVRPVLIPDDPFPPSRGPGGAFRARLRLVNAAPFAEGDGDGAFVSLFVTPGTEPPADVSGLAAQRFVSFAQASDYLDVDAGGYVLTVTTLDRHIIAQLPVTLASGAVRTFVIGSAEATADPSPANHTLLMLVDADY